MGKRASCLVAAGLMAGLGIDAASPRAAAADQAVVSAEVSFGLYALGAKGMDFRFTLRRDARSLQVETAMRTVGVLDFATSFTMTGLAAARIDDDRLVPLRYVTQSDGTWSKRATQMSWDASGMPVAILVPPNEEDDREDVPDALKRHTLDPNTATMARLLKPGLPSAAGPIPACNGTDAIYDGRRRYNIHFTPLGPDRVEPHNRTAYSGPAYKCRVKVEPVAGYSRKYLADWSEKDEEPIHIWLAQPPDYDIWVPVQVEASARIGAARAWISGAKLNGREWLKPLGPIRSDAPLTINY